MQKQVEPETIQLVQQSGTGVENQEDKVDETTSSIESIQEIPSNPQAEKMNPKIYNSFQHPAFVKTDKILFDLKRNT